MAKLYNNNIIIKDIILNVYFTIVDESIFIISISILPSNINIVKIVDNNILSAIKDIISEQLDIPN